MQVLESSRSNRSWNCKERAPRMGMGSLQWGSGLVPLLF